MNPHIRMKKNGDRVMAILFLELLLTGGTLLHTDADVRMMSREVLMCPSISFMQLTPLPHKTNEIKVPFLRSSCPASIALMWIWVESLE
jgi:hypothetical protein